MKTLTIDPVCGKEVSTSARFHAEYGGIIYLFCCETCRARFQHDPGEFFYPEDGELEALARNIEVHLHEPEHASPNSGYVPLLLIPGLALLLACITRFSGVARWDGMGYMRDFTGFSLILLSAFALSELKGFAKSIQIYDFLAKSLPRYGYFYPFLELGLGLSFLASRSLIVASAATAGLMVFSSLGLATALRRGNVAEYANTGPPLKLPPSAALLIANLSLAAMSVIICWFVGP